VFFSVSMSLDGFIAPESLEDLMDSSGWSCSSGSSTGSGPAPCPIRWRPVVPG
jgi:hypothetical protein